MEWFRIYVWFEGWMMADPGDPSPPAITGTHVNWLEHTRTQSNFVPQLCSAFWGLYPIDLKGNFTLAKLPAVATVNNDRPRAPCSDLVAPFLSHHPTTETCRAPRTQRLDLSMNLHASGTYRLGLVQWKRANLFRKLKT